jgi:protoporphyrinogen oxidase
MRGSIEDRFADPETTAQQALCDAGFSKSMIERFFRPFFGGIFLDADLQTSSRMLSFVFRMFSIGKACLPAEGMEAIPRQLAALLPSGSIRLGARVVQVGPGSVRLANGEELIAKSVVVAVEGRAAAELLGDTISTKAKGTTCLYFSAPRAPISEPLILLNGDGRGPINSICVPTVVAPSYGPADKNLVSVTVLGTGHNCDRLLTTVREQLTEWFGSVVQDWRHLRTYDIAYALPAQSPPSLSIPERPVRWSPGIYVCGDHRDNASINGALVSGRRAAEAVIKEMV